MNANLYTLFASRFPADPAATLLETEEGSLYTYRAMADLTARMANALEARGVRPGDRVAAQVEKSPEALALYLACLRAGYVYLPLNTAYQPAEIEYFLGDATPAVFVCRPEAQADLSATASRAGVRETLTLGHRGDGTLLAAASDASADHAPHRSRADDLAIIIYTSGTTGRSKGAMLTHGNLAANGQALSRAWAFTATDVLLHALPLFHVHGLFISTHCVLLTGARMLFLRKFDGPAVMKALPRVSVMMGVPTYYTRLLAESSFDREAAAHVRLFVSGSAPLLAETFHEFEARTGQRILERYGMSEAGVITTNPLAGERKGATVGRPLEGMEVRVADSSDRPLPAGEAGGVQIRGSSVFVGYWRMPEKTQAEFTNDGWFRTGDVGVLDADGYLAIVGRAKDLIITGGYNVYPKEIELELDAMPGIVESAVIGVPHADYGEAVTAIVVIRPGHAFDESSTIAALKTRLANYKIPKHIHVVNDLPRNAMGKVQKVVLRQQFGGA